MATLGSPVKSEFFADDEFYRAVVCEEKEKALANIREMYADKEQISQFDVRKVRNTARMIEAKRRGSEVEIEALLDIEKELDDKRARELKDEKAYRARQNDDIVETFDAVLERA